MSDQAPTITREQRRSRRKHQVRGRSISTKRMSKFELEVGRALYPETNYWRPSTRADCTEGPRPCPFVACRWNVYLDVSPRTGAIKLNFPDLEVWEMGESCTLDVAARGGAKLEDVGAVVNITRERVRQIEVKALAAIREHAAALNEDTEEDAAETRDERAARGWLRELYEDALPEFDE